MLIVARGCDDRTYQRQIDEMFCLRRKVFKDRLDWEVTVDGERETDVFDRYSPVYLMSIDPISGSVVGSLRLLQTTGPNMLRDVFHQLLPEGEVVESPTIWESSRFCVDHDFRATSTSFGLRHVTGELLAGAIELGTRVGLTSIVSVFDARMLRILRTAKCPAELIGEPVQIGQVKAYAGLFDVSPAVVVQIASAFELSVPLFEAADPLAA